MSLEKCKRCSRHSKSVYHVGKCPKAPEIEFLSIDPANGLLSYNDYTEFLQKMQRRTLNG